jgi:hypothetical protein
VYPIEYQQSTSPIGVPLRVPNRRHQQQIRAIKGRRTARTCGLRRSFPALPWRRSRVRIPSSASTKPRRSRGATSHQLVARWALVLTTHSPRVVVRAVVGSSPIHPQVFSLTQVKYGCLPAAKVTFWGSNWGTIPPRFDHRSVPSCRVGCARGASSVASESAGPLAGATASSGTAPALSSAGGVSPLVGDLVDARLQGRRVAHARPRAASRRACPWRGRARARAAEHDLTLVKLSDLGCCLAEAVAVMTSGSG